MNESILSSYSTTELMINGDEESIEDEEIYPEDEIDDDDDEDDEDEEEEQTSITPPPPPPPSIPSERGGRRKGVPKRLQIVDEHRSQSSTIPKTPPATILTSFNVEQEQRFASVYHNGNFDENNNEEENTLEIVDDLLADLVGEIVRKIREERQQKFENKPKLFHNKHEEKFVVPTSTQSVSTTNKSSMLFNEINKTKATKSSRSPPPVSSSSSSSSTISSKTISNSTGQPAKRPKLSNDPSLSLQHQQLLWQMTQQLLMPNPTNDLDSSSILKQQLLGGPPPTKRSPGRPPKHSLPPQAMRSSTNMTASPISQTSNFAPRRRGRPPKYVTERPTNSSNDFDQLFAAIENSGATNPHRTTFQTALASMLAQPTAATRNGTPASMMKQSAGQTRQAMANAIDLGLNIPKKRGPGRPPKNQTLVNSHATNINFPPTMVPSSTSSFDFNAALIEMFQQQQQQQHPR